ncbi:MAG: acetyl-CoA hydrolase [Clostridia bacterium]|nr:acetyl-CoA hydrolase [Clostridia bacterium]
MKNWELELEQKIVTCDEAVRLVKDGDRVHIGYCSSVAYKLAEALAMRREELHNVVILSGLLNRPLSCFGADSVGHISNVSFFVGSTERTGIRNGVTDFTSLHLSQSPYWVRHTARPNVAFLEVSAPDDEGYMSYGASGVGFHEAVKEYADTIILQINKNAPYVFGEHNKIHISEATAVVFSDDDVLAIPEVLDDTSREIAKLVVDQVPDGATIQLGIGAVSNAVGYALACKNDLGVHTEMYTDSMMQLQKDGVITNRCKSLLPGKSVTAFALGSKGLYEYVHRNEELYFCPFSYVNDPAVIGQNDRMISINTAMAMDLYGQVAADSIGLKQQSAVGGQLDYVRGAQRAKDGKSIIAMPSTIGAGEKRSSRIMLQFPPGTAITTPRSDVQYVATEYGCVNIRELPMRERIRAMISLAHPDYRNELEAQAKEYRLI